MKIESKRSSLTVVIPDEDNAEKIRKLADQLYELSIFCFNVDYNGWCELLGYDPDNDYSREKWNLFQRNPLDFICAQNQKRHLIAKHIRMKTNCICGISDNERLLGEALHRVLIKDGVLNTDSAPTGPELILAAEDYAGLK